MDPFHDSVGVLRVGGRLKHADLSTAVKHPIHQKIILHYNCIDHMLKYTRAKFGEATKHWRNDF